MKIHYNPILRDRAKELRKNSTFTERLLWKYLRSGQLLGYKFQRQKPIDEYIVDFYCSKLNLIIEINGITHIDKQQYDRKRENRLCELGFEIVQFDGYYLLESVTGALAIISNKIVEIEDKTTP